MSQVDSSPKTLSHNGNTEKLALRSALAHAVGSICEQERGERGLDMDPNAVSTLSFVVEQYMKSEFAALCSLSSVVHSPLRRPPSIC